VAHGPGFTRLFPDAMRRSAFNQYETFGSGWTLEQAISGILTPNPDLLFAGRMLLQMRTR
jgi:hypothetical protein